MDWNQLLQGASSFLNSGLGFVVIWAGLVVQFVWLSSKWNPFQKAWEQYEGSIITTIKLAEQQVPDNVPNKGLARLDAALRFVLQAYAEANSGKQPTPKLTQEIKQGIQIKHAELERLGNLRSS